MVLQSITEFDTYSLFSVIPVFHCLCHLPKPPVASRVHDVFRPFFIQGRGVGVCGSHFVKYQ